MSTVEIEMARMIGDAAREHGKYIALRAVREVYDEAVDKLGPHHVAAAWLREALNAVKEAT